MCSGSGGVRSFILHVPWSKVEIETVGVAFGALFRVTIVARLSEAAAQIDISK